MNKVINKKTKLQVCWRSTFLQGSWNFERMQNGGFAYAMLPALDFLYEDEELKESLRRNLAFFNTQPFVASPIIGVCLKMEEERANGKEISKEEIQDVKVAMMGPLAGVGDPLFWFTARPIIGAISAYYAIQGSMLGPIIFFAFWNILRFGFMWWSQELAYKKGTKIIDDISYDFLGKVIEGCSIIGMFILGALVLRNLNINITLFNFTSIVDSLLPGTLGLLLTLLCCKLIDKKVSPILLIILIFIGSIILHAIKLI